MSAGDPFDFYIMSVDGCCHCGDCECNGIGCIASLDADDIDDHPAIDRLHDLLRAGQAWQAMEALVTAGEPLASAHVLVAEALAGAENRWAAAVPEQGERPAEFVRLTADTIGLAKGTVHRVRRWDDAGHPIIRAGGGEHWPRSWEPADKPGERQP